MELQRFFIEFQDFLAPKLDTYKQAIYLDSVFMAEDSKDQDAKALGIKTYNRDNFNKFYSQINKELKNKLDSKTETTADKA